MGYFKVLGAKQNWGEFDNIKGYINAQTAPLYKSWFYSQRCFCLILCNSLTVKHSMLNFVSFSTSKQSSSILHSRFNVSIKWMGQRPVSKLYLNYMSSNLSTQRSSSVIKVCIFWQMGHKFCSANVKKHSFWHHIYTRSKQIDVWLFGGIGE